MNSEACSGREEVTPKFPILRGSAWYWKASLLRGETCQVSWSAWICWSSVMTAMPRVVLVGISRSIHSCDRRYHSRSLMIGPETWKAGWTQSNSGSLTLSKSPAPSPSSSDER